MEKKPNGSYRLSKSWGWNGLLFWNIILFYFNHRKPFKNHLCVTVVTWHLSLECLFMNSYSTLLRWSMTQHRWSKWRKRFKPIYPKSHNVQLMTEVRTKLVFAINISSSWTHSTYCAVLSRSVMSDSVTQCMDCSLAGYSVHGDSPGKNTGMVCHALLQGIFPTQGIKPRSPTLKVDSLPSELPEKPSTYCTSI